MHCDTATEEPLSSSNHLPFLIICPQVKELICHDKSVQLENCGVSTFPAWNNTGQHAGFQKSTPDFYHESSSHVKNWVKLGFSNTLQMERWLDHPINRVIRKPVLLAVGFTFLQLTTSLINITNGLIIKYFCVCWKIWIKAFKNIFNLPLNKSK